MGQLLSEQPVPIGWLKMSGDLTVVGCFIFEVRGFAQND
jgi:hypothetical protein